jgi:hypothetical protein
MLKRLLITAAMAASTLLVTGTVTSTAQASAQASEQNVCSSAQPPSGQCQWREDGCYYCYSYRTGSWERQHCGD